ncbi:MAG: hypothetical protein IRY86_12000 [Thermorudis peleae]|nr:hypothetical protein [Thermorudis peleae]
MAETHPFRLRPNEVIERAHRYFGDELGMELVANEGERLRYEDAAGFVELIIRADGNNQSRVTFAAEGHEEEVRTFRRRLAQQAAAETASPE